MQLALPGHGVPQQRWTCKAYDAQLSSTGRRAPDKDRLGWILTGLPGEGDFTMQQGLHNIMGVWTYVRSKVAPPDSPIINSQ